VSLKSLQDHLENCHTYSKSMSSGWTKMNGASLEYAHSFLIRKHCIYHAQLDIKMVDLYPDLVLHDHGLWNWRKR